MPDCNNLSSMRSPLKWAGGKKKLADNIKQLLPSKGKGRLIEPFVGGGSVFLNSDFDEYLLLDMNKDLINLFNILKSDSFNFITEAEHYFQSEYNTAEQYYELRAKFNKSNDPFFRSLIFLYMNRHGYNGLCRYNKSGGYNVPFGRYKKPYFPKMELEFFAKKSQRALFIQGDFDVAFNLAKSGDAIYCDPPYSPINRTSNFTSYAGNTFDDDDQIRLVKCAEAAKNKNIPTLISNHDTEFTREIYSGAKTLSKLKVHRSISSKGHGRVKVFELMVLYEK
ncbi:Dam family site-specific DNA-(adenine-N6)-methyltransferase [Moritella sp.]|uniref:Dam family site-specific DNA-(adenine-N6)-methyltransferase n=1 Tax=Moritella sp. TaxID=78556 RepID=UPI001D64BC12|nr:Dam family site-specific DNA-(adenine-N6)-methyltransferase [Moritella sp.]MCJ8349671.1 Dam family site-specific DNA-(adenine-N6)-methyltransferase [Moritella sp.]NQZ39847.1 Dam family site-specific DNA-(adenine-N6)-methyltransferase [Moritella sp.]